VAIDCTWDDDVVPCDLVWFLRLRESVPGLGIVRARAISRLPASISQLPGKLRQRSLRSYIVLPENIQEIPGISLPHTVAHTYTGKKKTHMSFLEHKHTGKKKTHMSFLEHKHTGKSERRTHTDACMYTFDYSARAFLHNSEDTNCSPFKKGMNHNT
jgi:hypothetical protein